MYWRRTSDTPKNKLNCDFEIADAMDNKEIEICLVKKHKINTVYHLVAVLSATGEENPFKCLEIKHGKLSKTS